MKWWPIIICNYEYFETSAMSTSDETFNSAHLRPQFDSFGERKVKVIPGKEPRAAWLLTRHRRCWCGNQKRDSGFLTAVLPKHQLFRDVTPCLLVNNYWPFEWSYCLHIQGQAVQEEFANPPGSSSCTLQPALGPFPVPV